MNQSLEDHNCPWRTRAEEQGRLIEEQTRRLEELSRRIEQLERILYGKRSEKIPTTKNTIMPGLAVVQETRALRRKSKSLLPEVRHVHEVKGKQSFAPDAVHTN